MKPIFHTVNAFGKARAVRPAPPFHPAKVDRVLAILLVGSLAVSAPVPKETAKPSDIGRILGAWDVYPDDKAVGTGTTAVWTFTAGKMHSSSGKSKWMVQLEDSQSPKQFTLSNARGSTRGKRTAAGAARRSTPGSATGGAIWRMSFSAHMTKVVAEQLERLVTLA